MTAKSLTVRYVNADESTQAPDSFLSRLVSKATSRAVDIVRDSRVEVDVQFTSVQIGLKERLRRDYARGLRHLAPRRPDSLDARWASHNPLPQGRARSHVWFTGENVRPPVGPWDAYLSFDMDPFGGRNAYCPLWWWSLDLLGAPRSTFMDPAPSVETLLAHRPPGARRPGFVVAFINNPDPMRLHMISLLKEVGPVDVFGGAVGRPVPNKALAARDYKFVLCFENDLYPGYVTEKPIEAWACGSVPIWWGLDPAGYINPGAVIDAATASNFEAVVSEVDSLAADEEAWAEMVSRPLLMRTPDLTDPLDLLSRTIGR